MRILPTIFLVTLLYSSDGQGPKNPSTLQKSAVTQWKFFDGNTIQSSIANDGPYSDYRRIGSSGLIWPKGTSKTAVFTSGLWIVGKHRPTNNLRTAVEYYFTEFQPGPINGTFNTTTNNISVASNPNDSVYRIYKINKGDNDQNNPDYADWPGQLGAPYNDLNNNGVWDKGIDTPQLFGDQTLWCIYNDLDTTAHQSAGTTLPMGMEVHAMYYGFNSPELLENTMFIKWKIINKSDSYYDSTFFGLFSDVDMGQANDDVDGYDTTLSLAYVYNGDNDDGGGYGDKPPAVGTTFLDGKPSITPYAYPMYLKHGVDAGDLYLGDSSFPMSAYNYLRGLKKISGLPNINPITGLPDRFVFTGDPVTNTGWTKVGSGLLPNDVRSLLSLGPITLAPGDTQEVNAAFVVAQGIDHLNSLSLLRNNVAEIKTLYKNNFVTRISETDHMPTIYSLEQNYPNPFNPSTTIRYSIPVRASVTLTIYNILGQNVSTLVNEVRDAGIYSATWNGKDLLSRSVATGLYFYRLETESFHSTKKMLLLK